MLCLYLQNIVDALVQSSWMHSRCCRTSWKKTKNINCTLLCLIFNSSLHVIKKSFTDTCYLFSDSSRKQLLVLVLSLILQMWTGYYIVDFCFPLFFLSDPTFLRKKGWKMLAALASLAFLKDALAFPQMKIFWKEYFSDRPQGWGFG